MRVMMPVRVGDLGEVEEGGGGDGCEPGGAFAAMGASGAAAVPGTGKVVPQPGQVARRPAHSSFTRNALPQFGHAIEIDMVLPFRPRWLRIPRGVWEGNAVTRRQGYKVTRG